MRKPSIAISPIVGRRESHKKRHGSSPLAKRKLLAARFAWLGVILWGEVYTFWSAVASCSWPSRPSTAAPHRLLIISDPQIPDHRSYPGRALILQWLGQAVIDNYLRKAYRLVISRHAPQTIVFNGDLLDSGHQADDRLECAQSDLLGLAFGLETHRHANYVKRFKRIFAIDDTSMTVLYVPGNHDTGLGLPSLLAAHAREQFRDAFGPLHGQASIGNHSIVWMDSMAALEERNKAHSATTLDSIGADDSDSEYAFIRRIASSMPDEPRILLSHIPLWRPPGTKCGSSRESNRPLQQGRGLNYQNLMDEDVSRWVLEQIKPEVIFSGDDHDACIVKHENPVAQTLESITEHTVRSLSMAMGVSHPGYELVSLYASRSGSSPSYQAVSCTLPFQIGIYTRLYLPLLILTLVLFALPRIRHILKRIDRSNHDKNRGLPLHHRTPSFLDYGREATATLSDPDEMEDANGYTSTPVGFQYSYHHGATEDDLPTPAYTAPLRKSRRPSTARVRRVSRVWLWDGRSRDGRDVWIDAPPVVRAARRVVLQVSRPITSLLRRVLWSEPIQDVWQAIWPALALAVVVWMRYW